MIKPGRPTDSSSVRTIGILIAVIAVLYLAREIFIPLAFAITLTLILTPATTRTPLSTSSNFGSQCTWSSWNACPTSENVGSVSVDTGALKDDTYTVTLDVTFTATFITVGGVSGTQTLSIANRTLTVNGVLTVQAGGVFSMSNSTVNGAGSVVNQATATLYNSTLNAALTNKGTLVGYGDNTLNGNLETETG